MDVHVEQKTVTTRGIQRQLTTVTTRNPPAMLTFGDEGDARWETDQAGFVRNRLREIEGNGEIRGRRECPALREYAPNLELRAAPGTVLTDESRRLRRRWRQLCHFVVVRHVAMQAMQRLSRVPPSAIPRGVDHKQLADFGPAQQLLAAIAEYHELATNRRADVEGIRDKLAKMDVGLAPDMFRSVPQGAVREANPERAATNCLVFLLSPDIVRGQGARVVVAVRGFRAGEPTRHQQGWAGGTDGQGRRLCTWIPWGRRGRCFVWISACHGASGPGAWSSGSACNGTVAARP